MTLAEIQTELCVSGIGRETNPISLLKMIAQLGLDRSVSPAPVPPDLLNGLIAYYNLDEAGTADAVDSTGGAIGSLFDVNTLASSVAGPGLNLGRELTGTELRGYVDFTGIVNTPFTFSYWTYKNTTADFIAFNTGFGAFGFLATMNAATVFPYANPGGVLESPGVIAYAQPTGEWVMTSFVWDGTDALFYVNGVEFENVPFSLSGDFVNNYPLAISWDGYGINGAYSLFGIWDRALTAVEVDMLYNLGSGLNYGEL